MNKPFEFTIYTTLEEALTNTEYVVEATRFEQSTLWEKYHGMINWKDHLGGWLPTVGFYHNKPICISTFFTTINGVLVLFWHDTSLVVNFELIEQYLEDKCHKARSFDDVNNFNLNYIKELSDAKINQTTSE